MSDSKPVPIVIYLVDTLRADRLGAYGYDRGTSPRINAFAKEAVVFEAAYAAAPWTLPSVASIVTSTYQCEHGLVLGTRKLDPALLTLAERLKAWGYRTAAWYNNEFAGPMSGVDRGYQISEALPDVLGFEAETRRFLADSAGQPFLLYLHGMEPHEVHLVPYEFTRPFGHVAIEDKVRLSDDWITYKDLRQLDWITGSRMGDKDTTTEQRAVMARFKDSQPLIEKLYDASVLWADHNVGKVIDVLKERNLWDKVVFIVVADHGEEFGEHGAWFHGDNVYESTMHVPLLIRFPGGQFGGTRVPNPVSLVDLMPTILDFLRSPDGCTGCRGQSLMPLVRGDSKGGPRPVPALRQNAMTYFRPLKEASGDVNVMWRQGNWNAIWNEEPATIELYDMTADPREARNLSGAMPELAAELRDESVAWLEQCRTNLKAAPPGTIDAKTQERLRALGYLK